MKGSNGRCQFYFRVFFAQLPVILTLAFFTLAQVQPDNATLRVLVISEDYGTPVVGATIFLSFPDGDTLRAGATDIYGFHEFSRLRPAAYRVHISYIGYETRRETLTLGEGETRILQTALVAATEELDEVLVQVARGVTRREAGRQTITSVDLQRIPTPGPGGDLTTYLQTLPAVVMTGDRGGELFIRGGTPIQNLVLVDNMPVIKPFHIFNFFSAFPQEIISSVDLYAGGFGAEYSGATSSVLDVSLRQGNMRRFGSQAAASPYMVSLLAEGPLATDRQSLLVMGRHSTIEQTGPWLTGEDVPMLFYDITARYSVNWPGLACNITGLHTYDRGRINPQRGVNLTWNNTALGLRCMGFSEAINHTVDFTIGYSGYNSTEAGIDNIGRRSGLQMGYMRVDHDQEFFDMPANYGFTLNFTRFTARLDAPFANITRSGVRFTDLDSSIDELAAVMSGYVSVIWQPTPRLTVTPGLTSQVNVRDVSPTLEPRLRAVWRPDGTDRHEFSLATGRYLQLMEGISDERDAGTVFYVYKPTDGGDPLTESLHGIVGYRRQFGRNIGTSLESYVKRHRHLPVAEWTREPGNTIRTALADGITYGADIQFELDLRRFYLSFGYGLAEVVYEASTDDLVAWLDRPIFRFNPSHDRRHQFNIISSLNFAGFTAGLSWQYSSGSPFTRIHAIDLALSGIPDQHPLHQQGRAMTLYTEPYDGLLPSFHRLDVSLSRSIRLSSGVGLEAEIGAINSYNIRNVFYFDVNTFRQVDQTPVLPYASLNMKFGR